MHGEAMRRPYINLGALRGFEASARNLSFTVAAEELRVTQGAISRQVAMLERDLGVTLFKRMTRKIALTDAGQVFYEATRDALQTLTRAAANISTVRSPQTLTVSILPTLAAVWLMPRLHLFTHANPGTEVRIVTSIAPFDPRSGGIDVAICVGARPDQGTDKHTPRIDLRMTLAWEGVTAQELLPDTLVPVISRKAGHSLQDLAPREILTRMPLLHTSTRRHAWPDWLAAHGLPPSAPGKQSSEFGHFFMALDAARAGRGVALVPAVLLPDLEYRRQLQVLKFRQISSAGAYHLLIGKTHSANPAVQTFVTWLTAEAKLLRSRTNRFLRSS
ncbi:MAG: LysR family transcriptional regulator [Rhizobiales bacterium]|nr:LysR family transcriptional regulator [Hyphomicrobiales bacterium]